MVIVVTMVIYAVTMVMNAMELVVMYIVGQLHRVNTDLKDASV